MYKIGEGIRVHLCRSGWPWSFWPFAGQYFCAALNTTANLPNKTPYEIRYPESKVIPTLAEFGRNMFVVPKEIRSAECRDHEAVYLGHVVHPGGEISQSEVNFVRLDTLFGNKSPYISSTKDFRFPSEISFPCYDIRVQK